MEVQGTVKTIGETKEFGSKGFRKRDIVVTTDEQYPQHILIEFVQDNCGLLDSFKDGDAVKIGINLRGREWLNPEGEAKYFNSLQGWRIDPLNADEIKNTPVNDAKSVSGKEEEDDLPF
jgi:hypothetical protein